MKIGVYSESSAMSGRRAWKAEDEGVETPDIVFYEGSEAEIVETARSLRRRARSAGAGTDLYFLRTADTLLEAVGIDEEDEEESEEESE